ncbi:MAG: response regulator transcription factor [Eubacterium sp.]
MKEKIFLLEDDAFLRDGLCELLSKEDYSVTSASSVKEAEGIVKEKDFNLIILDVLLPDGNGFDLCGRIRALGISTPILFLTACDDEIQIVRGLDSGADDYVTKPFKLLEFMSRVRALLRRSSVTRFRSRDIALDINKTSVTKNGESIELTKTEFQILSMLIQSKGVIVTRNALLENIWDIDGNFIDDNTLSVHISRLREKIGSGYIATVRGIGYRWEEEK